MDGFLIVIWAVRLLFLALLYLVLYRVIRTLLRDLRAAAREPGTALGRLIVVDSPGGDPATGRSFDLDAITTLGRDVNNAIVIEDPFASSDHAILTYRGRSWYVEDLGSRNGTVLNGRPIEAVSPMGYGDELSIGQVLEGFYFTPRFVGERIGLHPLAVIFALLAFAQLFGFVGVFVALPASAVLLVAIRRLRVSYLASKLYHS